VPLRTSVSKFTPLDPAVGYNLNSPIQRHRLPHVLLTQTAKLT